MTVKHLIEHLKKVPQDYTVYGSGFGDTRITEARCIDAPNKGVHLLQVGYISNK